MGKIATAILLASVVAGPATAVIPPHVLPQPSIEERDDDVQDCIIYQTRVMQPPLIDWHCAEETADMDGGNDLAKNFATALLAVRDHRYEEIKK
jgi:hypothetical protein